VPAGAVGCVSPAPLVGVATDELPELPALPPALLPLPLLLLEEPQAAASTATERTATVATVFRVSFRTSTDLPIYRSSRYMTSADASTTTTAPSTTDSKPHVTNLPTRPAFTAHVPVGGVCGEGR